MDNHHIEVAHTEELVYTVSQVAKMLHVNTNYVYDLIHRGYLPALKFKSFRIRRGALLKFLEEYEGKELDF